MIAAAMEGLRYSIRDLKACHETVAAVTIPRNVLEKTWNDTELDIARTSVQVQARLRYIAGDYVQVDGTLSGTLGLICQRCLEETDVPFSVPLEAQFVPPADAKEEPDFDLDERDVWQHNHEIIDLLPVVREQVILSIPLQVLCKPDCQGLCPHCGENRNYVACTCVETPVSLAFAGLAPWKGTTPSKKKE